MILLAWLAGLFGVAPPPKPAPVPPPPAPVPAPAPAPAPAPVPVPDPPPPSAPDNPAPAPGSAGRYVALGDSYSAGWGSEITPVQGAKGVLDKSVMLPCGRATNNAARLLAATKGYALTDVSCGGATTVNILTKGMNGEPAQINAVTADTKLVTLTIGGNDGALLFLYHCAKGTPESFLACFWGFDSMVKQIQDKVTAMGPKVAATLAEIRKRAPEAQIRIAGYPYLLPLPGAKTSCTWASEKERTSAKAVQDRANAIIKAAAEAAGPNVRYADPHAAGSEFDKVDEFGTRDVCSRSQHRWINGDVDTNALGSVHPNAKGHQYYAQTYLATL